MATSSSRRRRRAPLRPADDPYGIVYLRVSDDEQTSVPEQLDLCRARMALDGIALPADGIYVDQGESRSLFLERAGVQAALQRTEDYNCVRLYVYSFSRLYGDLEQMLAIFRHLRTTGTKLFDSHGREENRPEQDARLASIFSGYQNEAEVIELRRRTRDVLSAKAARGRLIGRPPFGVKVVGRREVPCQGQGCVDAGEGCPVPHGEVSKKNDTVWTVDQDQVATLRMLFEWAASGVGIMEISRRLDSMGVVSPERVVAKGTNAGKTHGGVSWSKSNLRKLIQNEFYKGVWVWGRYQTFHDGPDKWREPVPESEWIRTKHALGALIDPDLWAAANRQIATRYKTREENRRYPTMLFDGFVQCGRCGWKMYPAKRANKRADGSRSTLFDYTCTGTYQKYSACESSHKLPASWLAPLLGGELVEGAQPPKLEVAFEESTTDVVTPELEAIAKRLVEVDTNLTQLEKLALAGFFDADTAVARKRELVSDRASLENRRSELLATPKGARTVGEPPAELCDLMPMLQDESLPIEERRQSLGRILDRIVIDRPAARVILREASLQSLEP